MTRISTIPSIQSLPCRIAVISDTHTSNRQKEFHPALLARLEETPPDLILHAGDITLPESLTALSKLAPTFAVRGNRDILGFSDLPDVISTRGWFAPHPDGAWTRTTVPLSA